MTKRRIKGVVKALSFSIVLTVSSILLIVSPVVADVQIKPPVILAPQPKPGVTGDQNFSIIADSFFDDMFKLDPSWATQSGFHEHDSELQNYCAEFIAARIAGLKSYRDVIDSLDPKTLSRNIRHDREILLGYINNELLSYDELKLWKKDPDTYSSSISSCIFNLVKRDFAPIQTRMKAVIAREKLIPQALEFARQNLDARLVPKIYAQIAVEQLPGAIDFFKNSVPTAFKGVKDQHLQSELADSTRDCVVAFKGYQTFLEEMIARDSCRAILLTAKMPTRKSFFIRRWWTSP